jgi:hypothetical protein
MGLFVHKLAMASIMNEHHVKSNEVTTTPGSDELPSTSVSSQPNSEMNVDEESNTTIEDMSSKKQEPPTMSPEYLKCLRKRNAIYSKRKYYKNKMYFEELQRRKEELKGMNQKLRSENEQLEELVRQAKSKVLIQKRREEIAKELIAQQLERQKQLQEAQIRAHIAARRVQSTTPMRSNNTTGILQESLLYPLTSMSAPSRRQQHDLINELASRRTSALVEHALHQQRQHQRELASLLLQIEAPTKVPAMSTMQLRIHNHPEDCPSPLVRRSGSLTSGDGCTGGRLIRAIEAAQFLNHHDTAIHQQYHYVPLKKNNIALRLPQQVHSAAQPIAKTAVDTTKNITSSSKGQQPSTEGVTIDLHGILEQYQEKKRMEAARHALNLGSEVATAATAVDAFLQPQPEGPGQRTLPQMHDECMLSKIINAGPASSPTDGLLYAHLTLNQVRNHKA